MISTKKYTLANNDINNIRTEGEIINIEKPNTIQFSLLCFINKNEYTTFNHNNVKSFNSKLKKRISRKILDSIDKTMFNVEHGIFDLSFSPNVKFFENDNDETKPSCLKLNITLFTSRKGYNDILVNSVKNINVQTTFELCRDICIDTIYDENQITVSDSSPKAYNYINRYL
jgi:hypothetical protein